MSTEYREIVWFEMKPDVYAGEKCNEVRPRWWGYADGDMDGGFDEEIALNPENYPPGTKVVISVPECPNCQQDVEICTADDSCDFDWKNWVECEYS